MYHYYVMIGKDRLRLQLLSMNDTAVAVVIMTISLQWLHVAVKWCMMLYGAVCKRMTPAVTPHLQLLQCYHSNEILLTQWNKHLPNTRCHLYGGSHHKTCLQNYFLVGWHTTHIDRHVENNTSFCCCNWYQCQKQRFSVITMQIVLYAIFVVYCTCISFLCCEGMKLTALLRVLMKFSAYLVCMIARYNILYVGLCPFGVAWVKYSAAAQTVIFVLHRYCCFRETAPSLCFKIPQKVQWENSQETSFFFKSINI